MSKSRKEKWTNVCKDPAYYFISCKPCDSFDSSFNIFWIHNKHETNVISSIWKHCYLYDNIFVKSAQMTIRIHINIMYNKYK